ncbi:MAG: type IV toxin-antitoxin system AbiEi family antitoxin [Legionellales bacterium]|nr:type IV toxin-antitoxin system AbiEi family antitoxin [Legionellales bacterium]
MKEDITTLSSYLDHLRMDGRYWLSRKEAIATLQISDKAFKLAAYRLSKKGALKRVRGDFFIIVPPEHRIIGALPAAWFIDALMEHLEQQYYVGLLTAAALHGAAHQQPMVFQVITNKPTRNITMGQVRIEFNYKNTINSDFYQLKKTMSGTIQVSTPEMTAFDLVRYMNVAGQVNHVATVLCELAEQLHGEKLGLLLKNDEVEITTAQRLGYLLDALQLPIDLLPLERQLKERKTSRRLLVVSSDQPIIEYNQRWHIAVNEQVEPDEL